VLVHDALRAQQLAAVTRPAMLARSALHAGAVNAVRAFWIATVDVVATADAATVATESPCLTRIAIVVSAALAAPVIRRIAADGARIAHASVRIRVADAALPIASAYAVTLACIRGRRRHVRGRAAARAPAAGDDRYTAKQRLTATLEDHAAQRSTGSAALAATRRHPL
jgi:hypothetical protein